MPLFDVPPFGSIGSEENTISYINALYTIELLRVVNIENADYQVAHQFGVKLNTPWKDDPQMTHEFLHEHQDELRYFLRTKIGRTVKKLLDGTELFNTEAYRPLPISPSEFNSILSGLDSLNRNNLMPRLFDMERDLGWSFNPDRELRHVPSNFGEIHVIDKLLCGVFDNYATTQEDLSLDSLKEKYGAYRKETLDNKVYACKCLMQQLYGEASDRTLINYNFWASILSVLYHSVIPQMIHPNRLERMYEKYILPYAAKSGSLAFGRKHSASTPEAAICHHLPILDCKYKEDTVLPHQYQGTAVAPNSLVEHYLVTQHLLEYIQPKAE